MDCCSFFDRFRNASYAHLKSAGFVIGWIGVCWRLVLLILSIILQVGELDDRPNIFGYMFLIILSSYCIFTLTINIMFLPGIAKEKPTLILMFLNVQGVELFLMLIYIILGSPLMDLSGFNFAFWTYLPLYIILLVTFIVSFIYTFQLFREIHRRTSEETV